MPDITMCEGVDCPLKNDCYRFTASPSEFRQSYFMGIPFKQVDGFCYEFLPIEVVKEK
jgi:hypothetical protein